jgi:hypothetical protein
MEFVEKLVNIAPLRHLRNVAQDGLYRAHVVIYADDILLRLSIDQRYQTLPGLGPPVVSKRFSELYMIVY